MPEIKLAPFPCHREDPEITAVGLAQDAVPENVMADVADNDADCVFETTTSRSPTAPDAARVQEAEAADALPVQLAVV
jgi:hypothetical protein